MQAIRELNLPSTFPCDVMNLCLCSQVALGDCNELLDANYDANELPSGKHSTKGLGQTAPDPKNSTTL